MSDESTLSTIMLFQQTYSRVLLAILLYCVSFPVYAKAEPAEAAWYSIIPPLLAVSLAFISKRIFLSLGLAIFVGSFLVSYSTHGALFNIDALGIFIGVLYDNATDPWNLKVIAFVLCILSMISIVIISGGLSAIVNKLASWANSRQKSQLLTYLAGLAVFIDDYANTMIIGSSMRPMTDRYQVSREKLAFIIDATAAPVAGLAIISTWIGYEVGLFSDSAKALSLDKDGYTIFLDAFIFRFYCILMLVFVVMTIMRKREFSRMYQAEIRAYQYGALMAKDAVPPSTKAYNLVTGSDNGSQKVRNAVIPFSIMFIVLFLGLWVDGNGLTQLNESIFRILNPIAWYEVIQATKNSSTILLLSAISGLLTAILTARFIANTAQSTINSAILSGLKSSLLPIGILLLAWSLKSICNDLGTGEYLVQTLTPYLSPIIFPALIFIIAAITAFGTGTSWGTMAILIPIAFPLGYALDGDSYGLITIICMAAVLDGAIFGDHCSPISDTTIMSSIASHCDHMHHVQTQLPYSLVVGVCALVLGYLPAAMGISSWVSYILGGLVLFFLLSFIGKPIEKSSISENKA